MLTVDPLARCFGRPAKSRMQSACKAHAGVYELSKPARSIAIVLWHKIRVLHFLPHPTMPVFLLDFNSTPLVNVAGLISLFFYLLKPVAHPPKLLIPTQRIPLFQPFKRVIFLLLLS